MAQRGDESRTDMLDLLGYSCLCSWCAVSEGCPGYDLQHRDAILKRIKGESASCSNHQPVYFRGIEGVRP